MTSPATELPTARGLLDTSGTASPSAPPSGLLAYPIVLLISLALHGGVLAAVMVLPMASFEVEATPMELTIQVVEPEPEPVAEPEPEPEPEVAPEPAAMAPPPTPRPERRVVEPPAPPPPVLTAAEGQDSGADWGTDPGSEDGRLGGVPGGTGTGTAGPASEAATEPAPVRTGPSRAELRARVMGYIRGLSGSLAGRVGYPLAARREHLQGVVILRLRLAADGRVLAVRMSRSSGHDVLDEAALASVSSVGSLPAPPDGVPWDEQRELPVPIRFQLQ